MVGATLTFLGDGVLLAIGVISLAAFVVVGVAELLRPEMLAPGEPASHGRQGSPAP